MSTKRLTRHVLAIAMIGGLFLGVAACEIPPPFFTASNADSPYLVGITAEHPQGLGLTQKYMIPGLMNQGAIDPDSEFCMYAEMWGDTPLAVFDGDSQMYRAINGDSIKAAELALNYIDFRPKTKDATDLTARFIDRNSNNPALCIDMTDVTTNKSQARTIFEFTILDVTDGGTHAWKAGSDKYMALPRIFYVREGTGSDSTSPQITDLSFAQGDTLAVNANIDMCFDEPLGVVHTMLVSPRPGNTLDVFVPLIAGGPDSDVHGFKYAFIHPEDLEYSSQYYLIIFQEADSDGYMPYIAPLAPISEDLNGNAIDGDSTGIFSTGDLNEVLGGNTTHVIGKYTYFYTEAPPE